MVQSHIFQTDFLITLICGCGYKSQLVMSQNKLHGLEPITFSMQKYLLRGSQNLGHDMISKWCHQKNSLSPLPLYFYSLTLLINITNIINCNYDVIVRYSFKMLRFGIHMHMKHDTEIKRVRRPTVESFSLYLTQEFWNKNEQICPSVPIRSFLNILKWLWLREIWEVTKMNTDTVHAEIFIKA